MSTFIGRTKGKKDAKIHLYSDKRGFPIRLCDGLGEDEIEKVEGPVTCRHCLGIQQGKRVAFAP